MELLLRLRSQAGLAPDEVAGIRLELNPYEADYPGVDNAGPVYASTTATKMSAQFCLAVGALDGRLSLADLARLDDPAICALAGRVEVARNPAVPERQSRLTVRRRGGGEVTGSIDAPVGRPDFDGIGRFALTMAPEMGLGADAAGELVEAIRSLDTSADLRRLLAAATAGT
jgi:2-methylcitrate dehydratase PrpD